MHQKGFAFIMPVIIVGILILVVLAFVFVSTDKPQTTKVVDKQIITPTLAITPQETKFISLDEIKVLMPDIVWEKTSEVTKKIFLYDDNSEPYEKVLTGKSSVSSQADVSVNSYFGLINDTFSSRGWEHATAADGPTGGMWGYTKKINGKTRYIEFSHLSCEKVGATCVGSRDGSTVFYSDEFE